MTIHFFNAEYCSIERNIQRIFPKHLFVVLRKQK